MTKEKNRVNSFSLKQTDLLEQLLFVKSFLVLGYFCVNDADPVPKVLDALEPKPVPAQSDVSGSEALIRERGTRHCSV